MELPTRHSSKPFERFDPSHWRDRLLALPLPDGDSTGSKISEWLKIMNEAACAYNERFEPGMGPATDVDYRKAPVVYIHGKEIAFDQGFGGKNYRGHGPTEERYRKNLGYWDSWYWALEREDLTDPTIRFYLCSDPPDWVFERKYDIHWFGPFPPCDAREHEIWKESWNCTAMMITPGVEDEYDVTATIYDAFYKENETPIDPRRPVRFLDQISRLGRARGLEDQAGDACLTWRYGGGGGNVDSDQGRTRACDWIRGELLALFGFPEHRNSYEWERLA